MFEVKKYKRSALMLSIVTGLLFLWFAFQQIKGVYFTINFGADVFSDMGADLYLFFAISFVSVPIMAASLIVSLSLLNSIRKEETPFTKKNTTKLKIVALLLIAYEVCVIISQRILYSIFFRFENPRHTVLFETSLGGVIIVLGLVVFCITLVFEYGITLQNQVDETL